MPQVKFEIKGLAACYRKPETSEFWTFVFPHDGHHKVDFSYTKGGTAYGPTSLANKNVRITAPEAASKAGSTDKFRRHVLDMTASYLHNDGLDKKQPNNKMMIQHAVLNSESERGDNFVVAMKFDAPNRPPVSANILTEPVSDLIGGTIEIPSGGKVVIEIEGEEPFELSAGDRFDIDNYCGGCRRDFLKYYRLFKNKGDSGKFCDALSIEKFTLNEKAEPIVDRGEPPAFCDGVWIGGDPSGLD